MNKEVKYWKWKSTIIDFNTISDEELDYAYKPKKKDWVFRYLGIPDNDIHEWYNGGFSSEYNWALKYAKELDLIEDYIDYDSLIYELKEQLQQKEEIINKISKKCSKEKGRTDFDIFIQLNEQLKTLEGFAKKIDYNLHPIITEAYKCDIRNSIEDLCKTLRYDVVYKDSIKEILDNKGE